MGGFSESFQAGYRGKKVREREAVERRGEEL